MLLRDLRSFVFNLLDAKPVIFPSFNGTLQIAMNSVFNISCESKGAPSVNSSYLQWSKRDDSGTFKNISLYASSVMLTRSKRITNQYIDVDTLTFKHFSKEDEGLYKCVRHMQGLSDTDHTETVIDIKIYGKFLLDALLIFNFYYF